MSAPKPPDPVATANAQAGLNRDTAITQYQLGATDQITPFGSLKYDQVGYWDGSPTAGGGAAGGTPAAGGAGAAARPPSPVVEPVRSQPAPSGRGEAPQTRNGTTGGTVNPSNPTSGKLGTTTPTPRFQATQTLSPEMQRIFNAIMGSGGQLSEQIQKNTGTPLSFAGLPSTVSGVDTSKLPTAQTGVTGKGIQYSVPGADDFSADRKKYEDALFQRLNPQMDRDRDALTTQLYNQGVMPGSEAYREAMAGLDRSVNDQRTQAVLAGGQEQQRMFDMGVQSGVFANSAQAQDFDQQLQNAGLNNTARQQMFQELMANAGLQNSARQQGIQETLTQRQQPINELAALLSSSQLGSPQFANTPQPGVSGVDYTGLVNNKYQADSANYGNMMSGMFGLGGTALKGLFSDRRLKSAVTRVGSWLHGLPLYDYTIFGRRERGVMADEVVRVMPSAVKYDAEAGFWKVDYGALAGAA